MPQQQAEEIIEIRSEEVQEILSHVPNWIIRWGITFILIAISIILVASWFIKYPDVVNARVTITTPVPPVNIVAQSNGAVKLLIKDNQAIEKNEVLAVIDNPATTDDVFHLINQCKSFTKNLEDIRIAFKENMNLGSLQNAYLQFSKSLNDYLLFEDLEYYSKQIAILKARIIHYQNLNSSLEKQLAILSRELGLAQQNFWMDSTLYTENSTSKIEKNRTESIFLQTKRSYETAKSSLINNEIQINQLNSQIADLSSKRMEQGRNLKEAINQSFEQLESQVESWKQQYLLISPIEGTVSLTTFWSNNQYVNIGNEVFTIIPSEKHPFGRVEMPVSGSGKVEIGQRVNIKLDNYPYQEYGMVLGVIKTKSTMARNNNYTLTLDLPNGLISSYKKELTFDREMQGTAEIITKDLRIMERVFNQFRSLMDNVATQ